MVASHSGEFTLWNGMTFNFETIMQAHESPILTMKYSNHDEWLLSGDQNGTVKYWQPNFNNVNNISAHANGVRDIAFSPNDLKFLTCGDDSAIKIWNFNNGKEERTLSGHHWEVKSADWHPNLGLIVSGSKDNLLNYGTLDWLTVFLHYMGSSIQLTRQDSSQMGQQGCWLLCQEIDRVEF